MKASREKSPATVVKHPAEKGARVIVGALLIEDWHQQIKRLGRE
jgi:hypothetical protein